MDSFEPFRTDVLFLLVGGNPLPNYVAAMLLARDGGTIYLVHSKDVATVADRLKTLIEAKTKGRGVKVLKQPEVSEANEYCIEAELSPLAEKLARQLPSNGASLNYTSGTKPMAAVAVRVLRHGFPDGCYSYLDAHSLCMLVRRGSGPVQYLPVDRAVEPSFRELFGLHGYALPPSIRTKPLVPRLCTGIMSLHDDEEAFKQCRAWSNGLSKGKNLADLDQDSLLAIAIRAEFDGRMPSDRELAQRLQHEELSECEGFFKGEWLENYTLDALRQATTDPDVQVGMSLQAERQVKVREEGVYPAEREVTMKMELDVAAIRGHQLFAISCQDTRDPDKAKFHLFEVFARARQLGGDEARFALVCCVGDPLDLQAKVQQEWDAADKIRVFGRRDLSELAHGLERWIRQASTPRRT